MESHDAARGAVSLRSTGASEEELAAASQEPLVSVREEIKRHAWKQRHWRTIPMKQAENGRCYVSGGSSDPDEKVVVKRGKVIQLFSLTRASPPYSGTEAGDKRTYRPASAADDDTRFPSPPTTPSLSGGEKPWWKLSKEFPVNVFVPPHNRKQKCQPGTVRALAGTACLPCMPGFRCPNEKNYETCAFPMWSPEGSPTCFLPGPHTNSMGVGSAPILCGEGTVSTESSAKCMLCPVNHQCVVNRVGIETPCPKNTFSDPGEAHCRYCPKNHDCTKGVIQPCPFGQVSDSAGTGCVDVADGAFLDPDSKRKITLPATYANDGTGKSFTWLYVTKAFKGWVPGIGGASSRGKVPCPPMALCTAGWYKLGALKNQWSSSTDVLERGAAAPTGWSSVFDQPSTGNTKQMFGYYGWARNSLSWRDDDFASPDNPCPTGYYSDSSMTIKKECVLATKGYCPRGSLSDCEKHEFPALLANERDRVHDDIYAVRTGYHALRSVKGKEDLVQCNKGHIIYGRTCYTGTLFGKPGRPGMMFKWKTFFASSTATRADLLGVCPEGHYCPVPSVVTKVSCPAGAVCPQGTKWKHQYLCLPGTYAPNAVTTEKDCQQCPPAVQPKRRPTVFLALWDSHAMAPVPGQSVDVPAAPILSSASSNPITTAPGGFWLDATTGFLTPCEPGSYTLSDGATSAAQCVAAPAGTYVSYVGAPEIEGKCSRGYYCPERSTSREQMRCPSGTYSASPGAGRSDECVACPAGSLCIQLAHTDIRADCPPGFFCPEGSTFLGVPCPAGTYRAESRGTELADCSPCPRGKYCPEPGLAAPAAPCSAGYICLGGAKVPAPTDNKTGQACPAGGFCPEGATANSPCPAGTYNPLPGGRDASSCMPCPQGQYCLGTTSTTPDGDCEDGYICEKGSASPTEAPASPGHYAVFPGVIEKECRRGTFTEKYAQSKCTPCLPGHFCDTEGMARVKPCPAGTVCPQGSIVTLECPVGTYSPLPLRGSMDDCIPCTPGSYCSKRRATHPRGPCSPGFFCSGGATTDRPLAGSGQGGPCPVGHYCPGKTQVPTPCPPGTYGAMEGQRGTYQPDHGQEDCLACPPGYNCRSGKTQYLDSACPAGTVCPDSNTTEPEQCPDGTYSVHTARIYTEACIACPPGFMCQQNNVQPATDGSADCPAGYACSGGVKVAGSGIESEGVVRCPKGFYCPKGTGEPLPCPAGRVCATAQLGIDGVLCPGGRYCPMQSAEGEPCPAGYYCPQGAAAPLRCPLGTISTYTENAAEAQCTKCPAGKYCDGTTNANQDKIDSTAFSGECRKGYYCPEGLYTPIGTPCPIGFYCPIGSASPLTCPVGSTTAAAGLAECTGCDAGFICADGQVAPCPVGQYCNADSLPQDCPTGSYNPIAGGISSDACRPCPPGKACRRSATSAPETCRGGYFCLSRVTVLNPATLSEAQSTAVAEGAAGAATEGGGRCPKGYYCPAGARVPLPCSPGYHCGTLGLAEPRAPCSAGYYCRRKANSASPASPRDATSCPIQDPYGACTPAWRRLAPLNPPEEKCHPHAFMTREKGNGRITSMTPDGIFCPEGHFCAEGTTSPEPCAAGTYQVTQGHSRCSACPAGFVCGPEPGTVNPQVCPAGHFCLSSAAKPTKCPAGKYALIGGLEADADCSWCPPGKICNEEGAATEPRACPAGSYCPAPSYVVSAVEGNGSSPKVTCGSTSGGAATCAIDPIECPVGNVCPEGSATPQRCPLGQTVAVTGAATNTGCKACPAGQYCSPSGTVENCAEGFLCISGAYRPNPMAAAVGRLCQPGYFCPSGTTVEVACMRGTLSVGHGSGNACDECPAGNVCDAEGIKALSGARACPAGSYCPTGSVMAIPCPAGTYSGFTYLAAAQECLACPAGKYCETTGATAVSGPCDEGTWCKQKSTNKDHSVGYAPSNLVACPPGAYCPQATPMPVLCQLGTYQDEEATTTACKQCLAGTYCGAAGLTMEAGSGPCKEGFFCNAGAKVPAPRDALTGDICQNGYYCPSGSKAPQPCPAGYYSDEEGLATCKACPAGYLCSGGAGGEIEDCPAGSFCEAAVSAAASCPDGTSSEVKNLSEQEQCSECPAGKVCGASQQQTDCPAGYLCLAGIGPEQVKALDADIDELWTDSTFWRGHAIHYGCEDKPQWEIQKSE
ncbi:hypothetical protein NCLIV_008255 [Neospora caninum Liverpool]|uniref:GCC2 and GCC3 domain-containing protein n=1 Tax=Neospora caninum (strain Liverpool) TaxID=572307 RepID=F0V9C9_NEOCL|nr:hypothetical protein NCLIV_008255 [Neospora caninum Liverpool]CBZ50354.1 hypothetical protein NCLIV_008255 [Neospora caninum Liverpool]|eukprot:XP_003880388.1 hypothetical protein NCLIV_008255 [Neospora caninum Liverpool]